MDGGGGGGGGGGGALFAVCGDVWTSALTSTCFVLGWPSQTLACELFRSAHWCNASSRARDAPRPAAPARSSAKSRPPFSCRPRLGSSLFDRWSTTLPGEAGKERVQIEMVDDLEARKNKSCFVLFSVFVASSLF